MQEITQDEYWQLRKRETPKYGNKRDADGDSQVERSRYDDLLLLEQAGEITDLRVKPRYELQPAFDTYQGRHVRAIHYTPDYAYTERGRQVVEDVKGDNSRRRWGGGRRGTRTDVFEIKAKLFQFRYPDIELRIIER